MLSVKPFNNIVQETGCTGVDARLVWPWQVAGAVTTTKPGAQSLVTLQYLSQGPLSDVTCNAMV